MNKKHLYEAPETELILVKFEGNFCATGDNNGGIQGYNGDSVVDQSNGWN